MSDITVTSNFVLIAGNFLFTIFTALYLAGVRIARMEVKVDTMWLFQLRRGMGELEHKGMGRARSDIVLSDAASRFMDLILPDLRKFYIRIKGDQLPLVDLAVAIEDKFGATITEQVCRKEGISKGACLVIAIVNLRGVNALDMAWGQKQESAANFAQKELIAPGKKLFST